MSAGRPRRNDEQMVTKRADELTADDYGCVVFILGNRGWLQCAAKETDGVFVSTTTGCAVYRNDDIFRVWGHAESGKMRTKWRRQREKQLAEYAAYRANRGTP